ncbi:gluconate 2-dehydrogenase subunit 3 family protein [Flavobacteriaceae bacterium]|jgi:hypothetical protein|nr:gluconate 2-dehydrogenase subunit 3 family protein [Flavobacteriaceae bacterium]
MKRRNAIKNLGLSFGSIALSGSVISLSQSCQTSGDKWSPMFFNKNQVSEIEKIMELIIPETDTPGAISLKIIRFADSYLNVTLSNSNKKLFQDNLNFLFDKIKNESEGLNDKNKIYEAFLKEYLNKKDFKNENEKKLTDLLESIRLLSVRSYMINEYVMTKILRYQISPGKYQGCADLDEYGTQAGVTY